MRKRELRTRLAALTLATVMAWSAFAVVPALEVKAAQNVANEVSTDTDLSDYIISDANGLKQFVNLVNNGSNFSNRVVKLANDIVLDGLPGNHTSIRGFAGIFDGCGYSISGIYQTSGYGLFQSITKTATVKNLTIKDSTYECDNYVNLQRGVGAIVGESEGMIQNCHCYNVTMKPSNSIVGGIAGKAAVIKNCSVVGGSISIDESCASVGGIVGSVDEIYNCCNTASVTSLGNAQFPMRGVGGVAGYVETMMQNCYSIGTMSTTRYQNCDLAYMGGIAGLVKGTAANCYYLDTAAEYSFGKEEQPSDSNKACTAAYLSSNEFLAQLNANRGNNIDWFQWEKRSDSVYPLPVKSISLANCVVQMAADTVPYNGSQQKPAVSVTYNGQLLVEGTDYTLAYGENVAVGAGSITVIGESMYMGTVNLTFTITKGTPEIVYTKSYKKTVGDPSFYLNASITNGADNVFTYKSSSPKTLSVDSNGAVSLLKPGKATITVTLGETTNYFGKTFKITVTVKPWKPSIYLSTKKRQLIMKWYRDPNVTGYELQYSTNKSFKKAVKTFNIKKNKTIKKTVKNLKQGRRYYVRIRSYKTVSGKKIYSSWSSKKSIRIK